MGDYIKLLLKGIDLQRLDNLPCLEFIRGVSERTGELFDKKEAQYHYCKITVYDTGIIIFSGSIHKLYNSLNHFNPSKFRNSKGFNGNQFSLKDLVEVKNHLVNLFDCEADQMLIRSIETGINTEPEFEPALFIKRFFFNQKRSKS